MLVPTVHLAAAAALLIMWQADPKRRYLLWWGISFALIPLSIMIGRASIEPAFFASRINMATFALLIASMVYTLIKGSQFFQTAYTQSLIPIVASILVFCLFFPVYAQGKYRLIHLYAAVALCVAWFYMAYSVWSKNLWQRFVGVLFFFRGAFTVTLVLISLYFPALQALSNQFGHSLLAITIVLSAMLLLVICAIRSHEELNNHISILNLSHGITTQLQGLNGIQEVAERIIPPLIAMHGWDEGILLEYDDIKGDVRLVSARGADSLNKRVIESLAQARANGETSPLLQSQKVVVFQKLNKVAEARIRCQAFFGYTPGTFVSIPLIVGESTQGLVFLSSHRARVISPEERALFETISHSVGMSIANAKHLEEMAWQAKHDSLTGLGNRSAYHEHVACLGVTPILVMLLDMNRFKEVNDTFGHNVGDQLLVLLGQRLQLALAKADARVFRLSGDEFAVVVKAKADDDKLGYAERINCVFDERFDVKDLSLKASGSIGVVESTTNELDSHELLRCADVAMYQAKKSNMSVAIYNRDADNQVRNRVQLLAEVESAMEANQFEMHYQPVVDFTTGQCVAAEALIRWQHPEKGLLSASQFMPYVETTEQIKPLTYQIIDNTFGDLHHWLSQGFCIKVSINLSARNLFDRELPKFIRQRAKRYQIPAELVQFEITESALMTDPDISQAVLAQLVLSGFSIALDDFGTGYSSLAYLAKFPIEVLKIDRCFVRDIANSTKNQAIVRATIEMSHSLEQKVVAEGIEHDAEAEFFKSLNCDFGQGYRFAKPMTKTSLIAWIKSQPGLSLNKWSV